MDSLLIQQAKDIIEKNLYITLATVGKDGLPWISPVYAASDEDYNFYWASAKNSKHSLNIKNNNAISFVVFDSSVQWGRSQGVYVQAKVFELTEERDILQAFKYRYKRINKKERSVKEFLNDAPRRIYKAVPEKIWINIDAEENGYFVDKRIELPLDSIK